MSPEVWESVRVLLGSHQPEHFDINPSAQFTPPPNVGAWGISDRLTSSRQRSGRIWCSVRAKEYASHLACAQSLTLLTSVLASSEIPEESTGTQLFSVLRLGCKNTFDGSGLDVAVHPKMSQWLNQVQETIDWAHVRYTIRTAWRTTHGYPRKEPKNEPPFPSVQAYLNSSHKLFLGDGGNVGLRPDSPEETDLADGYTLQPDNMDSPGAHYPCLVGLAALEQMARASGIENY